MPKNFKSPGCLIGLLIAGALLVLLFGGGLGSMFGGGGNDVPVTGGNVPGGNQGDLGHMFVASQVNNEGCPADQVNEFYADEPIYVGLERSDLPRGASVFARLYQGGEAIEDTDEIVADRAMNNTCVWFAFQPRRGGFDPGQYSAEIIVNGNPVDRAAFAVGGAGAGSALSNADVELGQMYTATGVTQNGCPVDDVDRFDADEPVYVALDESFVPAGTEVFARLLYEGQPVEDTDAIVADRDMRSCVWFAFEPRSGGFEPGNYEAQIYVNGQLADSLEYNVR